MEPLFYLFVDLIYVLNPLATITLKLSWGYNNFETADFSLIYANSKHSEPISGYPVLSVGTSPVLC